MFLPVQDALLLMLVVGSVCLLVAGDLSTFLRKQLRLAASGAGWPGLRHESGAGPKLRASGRADLSARRAPRWPAALPVAPAVADLLLVDDSAVARAKLRRLFEAGGYTVHLASDGVEALALLAKGRYAMMITDLEMPNMDGVTLIHQCLRQPQTAGMPIIAVSAHENLRAKFNECRSVCGVHRKPWVDDLLLSHVATQIGTRATANVFVSGRIAQASAATV